jgi:hypothetical protein
MKSTLKWLPILTLGLLLSSCGFSTQPPSSAAQTLPSSDPSNQTSSAMGSFTPLGTFELGFGDPSFVGQTITLPGGGANSHIQLQVLSTNDFDLGGYRYFNTVYSVRNASSSGVPYAAAKSNISFIAVETPTTLLNTPIRRMKLGSGLDAAPALAKLMEPLHGVNNAGSIIANNESFQAFLPSDVAPLVGNYGITYAFPYGFVVRNTNNGTRTLAGNPAANQFDGTHSLTYRIPLQSPVSNTPTKYTVILLAAQDSTTSVTESLAEKGVANSVASRVTATSATQVNTLVGSSYTAPGGVTKKTICQIPLSNPTAASPAYLINSSNQQIVTPNVLSGLTSAGPSIKPPVFTSNRPTFITNVSNPTNSNIKVQFLCDDFTKPVLGGTPDSQFVIQSFQTGKRLASTGTFSTLADGSWNFAPGAAQLFKAGEEAEVSLQQPATGSFTGPTISRFRISTTLEGATGFNTKTDTTVIEDSSSVAIGDLNADGRMDIVTDYENNSNGKYANLVVLLQNANGTFTVTNTLVAQTTGLKPKGIKLADIDNDGDLDVLMAMNSTTYAEMLIFTNPGNGAFSTQGGDYQIAIDESFIGGPSPADIDVGDIDGDGYLDAVAASNGSGGGGVRVSLQTVKVDSSIGFTNYNEVGFSVYSAGTNPVSIKLGDINKDGLLDIVTANSSSNNVSVLYQNSNHTFASAVNYATGNLPYVVRLADLNKDGYLDIATSNNGSDSISVLLYNPATSTYSAKVDYTTQLTTGVGTSPRGLDIGDINGDGKLDIAVTNALTNVLAVFIQNTSGNGTFLAGVGYPTGTSPYAVALGDMNGDGKLDAVTGDTGTAGTNFPGIISVLLKK